MENREITPVTKEEWEENYYWLKRRKTLDGVIADILDHSISVFNEIVQKTYIVEDVLHGLKHSHHGGDLEFDFGYIHLKKIGGIYTPVYGMVGGLPCIRCKFIVGLMRHNPVKLTIRGDHFTETPPIIELEVMSFLDSGHMESIWDYEYITKKGEKRIREAIKNKAWDLSVMDYEED